MVLKMKKAGVNSGNTIRCPNAAQKRCYATQSALVKYIIGEAKEDVVDNMEANVHYSLNKKERWELLKYLKRKVVSQAWEELPTPISLAERHKLKRENNCVALYTASSVKKRPSKRLRRKRLASSNTHNKYFSLPRPFSQPKSEALAMTDEQLKSLDAAKSNTASPEIRYELYSPCPRTSSLTHNPKYMESVATSELDTHMTSRLRQRAKTNRRHAQLMRELPEIVNSWIPEQESDDKENSECPTTPPEQTSLDMVDLIEDAMLQKALRLSRLEYETQEQAMAKLESTYVIADITENVPKETVTTKQPSCVARFSPQKKYGKGQARCAPAAEPSAAPATPRPLGLFAHGLP